MISADRVERSLRYLAESDALVAEAEGACMKAQYLCELIKDRVFITSEGTVAERQARAGSSSDLVKTQMEHVAAVVNLKKIKAKRATEEQIIAVYRTQEASRRQGA